jgi:hypothetical protein
MTGWRERATAIRAVLDRRKGAETAAVSARPEPEAALARQAAFAGRVLKEVLAPVAREFSQIVTGAPAKPAAHEYHLRSLGLTCELDSRRFSVGVFLLPDDKVRIAVSLTPSQTAGWHRDFGLDASNEEVEEWFGTALARLYEAA